MSDYIYIYTLGHICIPENWKHMSTQMYVQMFTAALFITAKEGHNPEVHQLWHIHTNLQDWIIIQPSTVLKYWGMLQLDEPWKHYAMWKKSDTKGWFLFYEISRAGNPERQKADWWLPGGWAGGWRPWMKKFCNQRAGGYTALWAHWNKPLKVHSNTIMRILPQSKEKINAKHTLTLIKFIPLSRANYSSQ